MTCSRCSGYIYRDTDEVLRCLNCARPLHAEVVPIPAKIERVVVGRVLDKRCGCGARINRRNKSGRCATCYQEFVTTKQPMATAAEIAAAFGRVET